MMNIAIIPARAGSKRIPKKNIKIFGGRPVISYSIEAAQNSGLFDRIIVSTDSNEIAQCAQDCGAEVPFIRPNELSDDYATPAAVIKHAALWLMERGATVDYLCCIYPVAPFIRDSDLQKGYELIRQKKSSSALAVTTFSSSVFRAFCINENGFLGMRWPENELVRSQDIPETYHDAGQFYWLECESFLRNEKIYAEDAIPVVLPRFRVQDIDTPEDWERAELMYAALMQNG